ncbi:MAG TPA: hypothetical protein VGD69_26895 [Herpetosiphonaceae bacterium]
MKKGSLEIIAAIAGVIIAAIALIPAFGQWLYPQGINPIQTLPGSTAPTQSGKPASTTGEGGQGWPVSIVWGALDDQFDISNVQFKRQAIQNPLGQFEEFDTLSFTVESRSDFLVATFFARFFDAEGIEVTSFMPLQFDPEYGQWYSGQRSRAILILPSEMSRVKEIRFGGL